MENSRGNENRMVQDVCIESFSLTEVSLFCTFPRPILPTWCRNPTRHVFLHLGLQIFANQKVLSLILTYMHLHLLLSTFPGLYHSLLKTILKCKKRLTKIKLRWFTGSTLQTSVNSETAPVDSETIIPSHSCMNAETHHTCAFTVDTVHSVYVFFCSMLFYLSFHLLFQTSYSALRLDNSDNTWTDVLQRSFEIQISRSYLSTLSFQGEEKFPLYLPATTRTK